MQNQITFLGLVALYGLAAIFSFQALRQARTSQGAAGWVIFLVTMPFLAVPAYLVLGQTHFPRQVERRREIRQIIRRLRHERVQHDPAGDGDIPADAARIGAFERLAEMPLLPGNRAELLIDGQATFDAIFEAIEQASRYILVSFYAIHDDRIGRNLLERLTRRARDGLKICVLYDRIGSNGLTRGYIADLRAAGVEITDFNPNRIFKSRFQLNFRNHRKIVVTDGQTGFIGGHNVGDVYLGRDPKMGRWRDTHIRVDGPVVAEIQLSFAEDWLGATGEVLELTEMPLPIEGGMDALILAPGPADRYETGALYFCNAIGAARDRLWIASPYFVPDTEIVTALKLAALRGVDVRILVPDGYDLFTPWLAAHAIFDEVREADVKIYRYVEGFMHQKVLLIDDDIASVGSMNLDNRSCRLNFEITLIGLGTEFNGRVAEMLERDFQRAFLFDTPLHDHQKFYVRYGAPIARLFAPIL